MAQQLTLYHGTNQRFAQFEQSKARLVNDFYGGGVAYFTDSLDVAKTYAKGAAKKGGDKLIYKVTLSINKLFDVDQTYTSGELTHFFEARDVEAFARGAGLLSLGADKYSVMYELEKGLMRLTGEQVFRGMSQGMVKTAAARDRLKRLGYDALRYNGGVNMSQAQKHNVYIAYDASRIKIHEPRMIVASDSQQKDGPVGKEQYVII